MHETARMALAELNSASDEAFVAALEGIWEHSPWVAGAVVTDRPFASLDALAGRMWLAVTEAGEARQLALLCAHPDLAGKLALAGELTPDSTREQASAGLDRLTPSELAAFQEWNARYRERMGFPFIICVREHTKNSIRAALRVRLLQPPLVELEVALAEVRKIAEYRLRDRITE
jgi:OHCU decarboxylase